MSLLLEHNIPVYENFCKCLEENHECILITATGTGKSYIVEEFLQQHNETALVVVPTKAIAKSWEELSSNVSVVTYTWFMIHYKELVNQFTYVVFDEAHHIGGDGPWGESVRDFRYLSSSTYFIGLTADSIRYNDRNKDVAEREFDGHVVYGYNTSEAVEKGILPNAKYVSALFNLPGLRRRLYNRVNESAYKQNNGKIDKLFGRLDIAIKNYQSIQQILKQHLSGTENRKGIVFVDSIKNIPNGIKIMQTTFNDPILSIHSNMAQKDVLKVIERFKSLSRGYIVAVDMLNEGVHIDGVNTIIMLRKTRSPSVYKQQIGRALSSTSPDKLVYIFDFVGNATEIMDYFRYSNPYMEDEEDIETSVDNILRDVENRKPRISNQFIIDDSTKEILSIVDQIQRLSKIRYYSKEEISAIFSTCNTYKEAMEKTGLNYAYLVKLANELGFSEKLSLRPPMKTYNADDIVPILKKCESISEVEKELDCSYSSAVYAIKKFGFKDKFIKSIRKKHEFSDKDMSIIEEMYNAPKYTYSLDDVANRLGVDRNAVYVKLIRLRMNDRFKTRAHYTDDEINEIIEICKTSEIREEAISRIHEKFPKMTSDTLRKYLLRYNSDAIEFEKQKSQVDDTLKKYYSSCGLDKVCEMLPKIPKRSIIHRANTLGLRNSRTYNRTLNDECKRIIEEYYPKFGKSIIKKFNLPINRDSLVAYTFKHGIKRITTTKNPEVINIVKSNMNDAVDEVREKIKDTLDINISNGTIYTIRRRLKKEEAQ